MSCVLFLMVNFVWWSGQPRETSSNEIHNQWTMSTLKHSCQRNTLFCSSVELRQLHLQRFLCVKLAPTRSKGSLCRFSFSWSLTKCYGLQQEMLNQKHAVIISCLDFTFMPTFGKAKKPPFHVMLPECTVHPRVSQKAHLVHPERLLGKIKR